MSSGTGSTIHSILDFAYAERNRVLVTERNESGATLAYCDETPGQTLVELQRVLNCPLELQKVSNTEFQSLIAKVFTSQADAAQQMVLGMDEAIDLSRLVDELPKTEDLLEHDDDAPIVRLLNALFSEAIRLQASDIHIETFEEKLIVRFRIDGVLREVLAPQRVLAPLIISRIKVMAKLDIAEKRLPQDGRLTLKIGGRPVDVRVSTMPAAHSERVVLRLLDKDSAHLDLAHLGMQQQSLTDMRELISNTHGIILVTGPTGSGKTTSLYAALSELNDVSRNILTVEDPIEYFLEGVGQTQVNSKVKMSFAKGLRAILRQDPDVVMVGEIRDLETAEIAVQASLTGHLVLSTLHTNSAIGAITRLRDMGIEPFLLSSSLLGVVGQRLVRVLCPQCKQQQPATEHECSLLGIAASKQAMIFHPQGCEHCQQIGYRGRVGIYEVITVDARLRQMIHENSNEQTLEHYIRSNTNSMHHDGVQRVLAGETSLEELLRVSSR